MEERISLDNFGEIAWRFANNTDPQRDCYVINTPGTPVLVIDGTLKTAELDRHVRDWPNIIASSDETIAAVDEKWNRLGIGPFIPSPSLRYRKFLYGRGAVADTSG